MQAFRMSSPKLSCTRKRSGLWSLALLPGSNDGSIIYLQTVAMPPIVWLTAMKLLKKGGLNDLVELLEEIPKQWRPRQGSVPEIITVINRAIDERWETMVETSSCA